MYLDVDGEPIRVLGDPDMSQECRDALADLARAIRRMTPEQITEIAKEPTDGE